MTDALVIGGGPAGLMAAQALLAGGRRVLLAEAKPSIARKLLMAGKSGLNLTNMNPLADVIDAYGADAHHLRPMINALPPDAIRLWAETLGQETFTGSTRRLFPKAMKASPLLRAWLAQLTAAGLDIRTRWRWQGWDGAACLFDTPEGQQALTPKVTILALGGGSWARLGSDGLWRETLAEAGLQTLPFQPSNAAISIPWSNHMTAHFGQPIKSVRWTAGSQTSRGEATLTPKGLEGGGIYPLSPALRNGAPLSVDLVPDLNAQRLSKSHSSKPGKARLSHWLKNALRLPPAKIALFNEMSQGTPLAQNDWAKRIKSLPIRHQGLRPLDEAISTTGGIPWDALDENLQLKSRPGTYCTGEMIDWDAPTGGYLLTACLATGQHAGKKASQYG